MENYTKKILLQTGFVDEVEKVNQGKCPFCNKQVDTSEFKDKLSLKEFNQSGICQKCMDKHFD